ncbi:MAG: CBS domain-containing protein [Candidatus Nezhaarchaeota archaeon]|nr:CBS domain-containing protein [Candidatus Nezhaarchaeota archaeon]
MLTLGPRIKVSEVMRAPPPTIPLKATLKEVAEKMWNERVDAVLIVDDEKLVGIVTWVDVAYAASRLGSNAPVSMFMTEKPLTIGGGEAVSEAVRKMRSAKIEHLPVVDEAGRALGLLSIHHIYGLLVNIVEQLLGARD